MTFAPSQRRTTRRRRGRTVRSVTRTTQIEELAHRESAGIDVSLLWSPEGNTFSVVVRDNRTGEEFRLAADPAEAMDVFRHPFAYKASRGRVSRLATDAEPVATR